MRLKHKIKTVLTVQKNRLRYCCYRTFLSSACCQLQYSSNLKTLTIIYAVLLLDHLQQEGWKPTRRRGPRTTLRTCDCSINQHLDAWLAKICSFQDLNLLLSFMCALSSSSLCQILLFHMHLV